MFSTRQISRWTSLPLNIFVLMVLLGGCSPPQKPDTGLYGTATHTGTLYSYRVPPLPALMNESEELEPRFVPLRGSMNLIEFVDGQNRIGSELLVTEDDLITVSLGAVYLKYFKEISLSSGNSGEDERKGEIVFVLSFDAGTGKRESFVVFSSGEQTLGSYLSVQDWTMLGPLKVDGESLKVRIVMIELDQQENKKIQELTRAVGSIAGQIQPGLAPALRVAQPIVDAIIALNGDDVILDQRFSLQRLEKGTKRAAVERPPLLVGRYVLILQEDRLKGRDVSDVARDATKAPALTDIRFDLETNRLYRLYDYWTDQWGWPADDKSELPVVARVDLREIPDLGGCPDEGSIEYAEHEDAAKVRAQVLGYDRGRTMGIERWNCLQHALTAAYCEGLRGVAWSPANKPGNKPTAGDKKVTSIVCAEATEVTEGRPPFDYPVSTYPTANAVLAQYPLHTHIILTIERSRGGKGVPVHEAMQSLDEFTKQKLDSVKDGELAQQIGQQLVDALVENRKQSVLLEKVGATRNNKEKLCLLFDALREPEEPHPLNDAPLYNEIYHVSGEVLLTREELARYLAGEGGCADSDECSCAQAVKTASENADKGAAGAQTKDDQGAGGATGDEQLLLLTDPPMAGEAISELHTALAEAGFAVPEDEAGTFGPKTNAAVRSFQADKELTIDGIVGADTRKALGI